MVRHELGFPQSNLHHHLYDGIQIVGLAEAIRDGSDLHSPKLGVDAGQRVGKRDRSQGHLAEVSSRVDHL